MVVGRSFFTLGGSEVVYDKGEFVSLNHHLRRALEIDGTQVGSSLYHLGEEYNASNLQSLDGGSGGLLISTKDLERHILLIYLIFWLMPKTPAMCLA